MKVWGRRRLALTAAGAVTAGLTRCAIVASPHHSGASPELVFGSGADVSVASADGKDRRQLTRVLSGAQARDPAWEPGGQRIAYSYTGPLPTRSPAGTLPLPETDVHVIDVSGAGPRVLLAHDSPGARLESPVWAPDGKAVYVTRIALVMDYSILRDVIAGVTRFPLDGGAPQLVVPGGQSPAVSPDGSLVACVVQQEGVWSIVVVNASGQQTRRISLPDGLDLPAAPRFSPDGRRILFTAAAPEVPVASPRVQWPLAPVQSVRAHGLPTDLFVVDVDGGNLRRVTRAGFDDASGVWSPDGGRVAVLTQQGIFTVNDDGSNLVLIDRQGGYGAIDWKRG